MSFIFHPKDITKLWVFKFFVHISYHFLFIVKWPLKQKEHLSFISFFLEPKKTKVFGIKLIYCQYIHVYTLEIIPGKFRNVSFINIWDIIQYFLCQVIFANCEQFNPNNNKYIFAIRNFFKVPVCNHGYANSIKIKFTALHSAQCAW